MKIRMIFLIVLCCLLAAAPRGFAEEAQTVTKAMIIQVTPGTIALPEGEAARIPLSAARIRSTDLRDLNAKYNAVAIEKLYRPLEPAAAAAVPGSGSKSVMLTKKEEPEGATLDMSKIIRKELRKKVRNEGRQVEEQPDAYLVEFELKPTIEMKDVVVAYWVLPVVTFVQEVNPEEE